MPDKLSEVRHFLYLDDRLVKEFVAQLEEGELDSLEIQSSTEMAGRAAGRLGVPFARAEGSAEGKERDSLTYSLRLSPPSRFQRLTRLLQEHGALVPDPPDVGSVPSGGFAIVECDVALTGLSKLALGFRDLQRSALFFGTSNSTPPSRPRNWLATQFRRLRREREKRRQLGSWRELGRVTSAMQGNSVPIIGRSIDEHETKLLSRLNREGLQVPIQELEGRARSLVKIVRQLTGDEVVDAADIFPGARQLTIAFRQGIEASDANSLIAEMTVRAPAAIVTTVAVYR